MTNRLLPDKATIRYPDSLFQSKLLSTAIDQKGRVVKCERPKHKFNNKKGIMDTQQNPNQPDKPPSPRQGGQQGREREEQDRKRHEHEKQGGGGGQQGGGQQGGR